MKKYKLTDKSIIYNGHTLYEIEAITDFGYIMAGTKGGYIESENNLSHCGYCWIADNAKVYDNAIIRGNAFVCDNAKVYGNAAIHGNVRIFGDSIIYEDASIHGNAKIYGNARVFGCTFVYNNATIYDNAQVYGCAIVKGHAEICKDAIVCKKEDYIIFKNWWSSGRFFTWTRSNNMWKVGCFSGTGEELITKAYKDSELSGREYERIVKYVESIIKEE